MPGEEAEDGKLRVSKEIREYLYSYRRARKLGGLDYTFPKNDEEVKEGGKRVDLLGGNSLSLPERRNHPI